jgi:NAD(P)-dependent dehydrogenase (short-subunit alcohol dehydrogenase family)
MSRKLKGRIAFVTAGGVGISLGAAKRFAEEGARVFITRRRQRSWARRSTVTEARP